MTDLEKLREKVASGALEQIDLICLRPSDHAQAWKAYNGSLDAAMTLHEAVLPDEGWEVWRMSKWPGMVPGSSDKPFAAAVGWGTMTKGYADNPARAWLLAILDALIAKETPDAD